MWYRDIGNEGVEYECVEEEKGGIRIYTEGIV